MCNSDPYQSEYAGRCTLDGATLSGYHVVDTRTRFVVCSCFYDHEDTKCFLEGKARQTAARVAACLNACAGMEDPAAAPDLLQAAENAVGMMQMAWKQYGVGGMFECMDALRAAIAKAKGVANV